MLILSIIFTTIAWFILDIIRVYISPFKKENFDFIKSTEKTAKSIIIKFIMAAFKSLLCCSVFIIIYPIFPTDLFVSAAIFFIIILFIKLIPEIIDRMLRLKLPVKYIIIESIISFIEYSMLSLLITYLIL